MRGRFGEYFVELELVTYTLALERSANPSQLSNLEPCESLKNVLERSRSSKQHGGLIATR